MELIFFTKFLKGLSAKEVGRTVKDLGFDGLDLAIRGGQCVDPANVATALPEAMKTWKDLGLSVPLVSMETRQTDPRDAGVRRLYEACGKAKIPHIKVGYWRWRSGQPYWPGVEAIRSDLKEFERMGRDFGVCTVIHTHSGSYYGCNGSAAMQLVRGFDRKFVAIYIDPAHLMLSGEPLDLALAIVRDYLAVVAVKNGLYVKTGQSGVVADWEREWSLLHEGLVDWPEAIALLKEVGYDGPLSLHGEYSGPEDRKSILERVARDITFLRKHL
ncbi:hypothetical protein AMJ85_01610 [candidate division BRC1 bacterium SM23_51]|nr:MAG: hypothetical protein AMJ85_01610 [candidate division BRC1 bacterium SM23_51]